MKNRLFLIVLSNILLAFVLVGGVVFAQDNPVAVDTGPGAESLLTNSISGRAVDGSGNGVAGVTVTATRVKYPIVFLPGVMGTFLRNEPRSDGDCASSNRPDGTIWLERNAGQWQLDLGSLRLNSTGNGPNNNCDRISPDGRLALEVFLGPVKVADYAPYELFLRQAQEDHGFNVLPYDGYDWRLTLTDAVTKLDTFIDANRGSGGKVYLVAHSMGGLLARAYVADAARAEKVAGVVTVGTPYLGAPVMAQRMVTGKTGTPIDRLLDSTQIKEIIHRSPGIQQLLPTTAYVGGLSKSYYLPVTGVSLNSYQEIADYFVQQNFLSGQTLDVAEAFHADLDGFDRNFYAQGRYAVLYTSDHETPSFIREKNCWFGDEDDVCGIDVERRLMGDETVPIGSSNLDRLSSAARADVAFYKCEDSEQNFKTHGDLFLDNRIIEDVLHLLKGEAVEHCDIETTLQASAAPTGFRQYTVWGEGRVQVVDAQGNITGVDESGILVRNLDDVTYLFTNGGIIVTMPLDAAYTLVTHDTGSQPMQIVAADFALAPAGAAVAAEEYAAQAQAVFNNISSADGGTVTISAAGVALTQLTLTVDSNADGTPESTLPPDGVLTDPVQIQDSGMPTTTLVVAGTQDSEGKYTSAVTVALTAEDGESGILRSYISLDSGQTWQEYTSQVQFELPPGESTTLQAYSVDRAGNQEYPPIMRELSFNAITGPVAIPAMISPEDGAVYKEDDEITLLWDTSSNASKYAAELFTSNGVINSGRLSANAWYLGTLPVGGYGWKVEAYNASHWSGWTDLVWFSVAPYTVQIQQIEPAPPYCVLINSTYDHERTLQILGSNLLTATHHVQFKRFDTGDQTIHFGGEVNWHSSSLISIDMATIAQHLWQEDKLVVAIRFTDHNYAPVSGWSPEFFLASSVAACGVPPPAPPNTPVPPAVFLPVVSGGQLMAAAQVELAAKVTSEPVAETPDQVIDPLMRSSERFVATTVYTVTTGADGRYTLTNLPAGDYVVRAARSGLNVTPSSQSVTVPPSQTDVNFTVTTTPTATPTATSIPPTATPSPGFNPAEEILIPAGSFQMGCDSSNPAETCSSDEQPLHTVTLDAYSIDKYEVTNARYKACVDAGGCTAPQSVNSYTRSPYYGTSTYADYPVILVNWHQASAFCAWAGGRLPTEAEWEKAARGSSDTRKYPWGNSAPDCTKLNYYSYNGYCVGDTSRVGSYPSGASPYGVMDMAGNVWEWVNDWYSSSYYSVSPSVNPQGPATGVDRVLRDGSWSGNDDYVRSAFRSGFSPGYWSLIGGGGFRCVRSQ